MTMNHDPFASLQSEGRLPSCSIDARHKGRPYRVTLPDGEVMLCEQCAENKDVVQRIYMARYYKRERQHLAQR